MRVPAGSTCESGGSKMLPLKKILCPTDFSKPSYKALDAADELAAQLGAELCLLYVVPPVHTIRPLGPYPGTMDVEDTECERAETETAQRELDKLITQHPLKVTGAS